MCEHAREVTLVQGGAVPYIVLPERDFAVCCTMIQQFRSLFLSFALLELPPVW